MLKKFLLAVATMIAAMGFAFAEVDVNKADQAALDSVRGIGPAKSKAILDERKKGNFKDWADFQSRVKGIGDANSSQLSAAGLTVNGQAKPGAPAAKEAKKDAKSDAKEAKKDAKSDAKESRVTIKEDAKSAKEGVKEAAKDVKEGAKTGARNVKEGAKEVAYGVKDAAVEVKNKVTGNSKSSKEEVKKDAKKDEKK